MEANRRRGVAPVPADLDNHLTEAQLPGLHKAEGFGWSIKFVRRAMAVLVYKDGSTLGVLEVSRPGSSIQAVGSPQLTVLTPTPVVPTEVRLLLVLFSLTSNAQAHAGKGFTAR